MKELVVISGKGGTGKTSIVASFAALAKGAVLADCDVDAADLYLVLDPKVVTQGDFLGGSRAAIDPDRCNGCDKCKQLCRFDAISSPPVADGNDHETYRVDPTACEGCGVCAWFCPEEAIRFAPAVNGQWFISETRCGPMVHARLGVAEENSGKLVTLVRAEAKRIAEDRKLSVILIDGAPGIGCPVIASIAGSDLVLVVTEPTLSGLHDLGRVVDLTKHFGIETLICINKWDLNEELAGRIEDQAAEGGLKVAGRVRYDKAVTEAQIQRRSVVEYARDGVADDVRQLWQVVLSAIESQEVAR